MNICPVCGYDGLDEPAYKRGNIPSDEICSSCGYQFGWTDDDLGITHEQWRTQWIEGGMKWWSPHPVPHHWNPKEQLRNINIFVK